MNVLELLRRLLPVARQVPGGPRVRRCGRDSFGMELGSRSFLIDCEMLLGGPHSFVVYPSEVYEVRRLKHPYEILREANGEAVSVSSAHATQVLEALKAHFDLNGITYIVNDGKDG